MPKSTGRPRMRSAAQIEQIRELHDQGLSYTEIADRLGISRQWARKLAIAPNPEGRMVVWVCKPCRHHRENGLACHAAADLEAAPM